MDLVVEHRGPDVRIVAQPDPEVLLIAGERVRTRGPPLAGLTTALNLGAHGAPLEVSVAGDRREAPPSSGQCHDFHVFLL